jgi:hypothetical protein
MKNIFFIGLTLFFLMSCEKSNIEEHENYIGTWTNISSNVTRTLEVKPRGQTLYEEKTMSGKTTKTVSFEGRFILEGQTLKVGFKKLTINKEPTFTSGIWLLTMDDIEYTGR